MTEEEFVEHVRNMKCYCCLCGPLRERIIENGIKELDEYDGFVCGAITSMKITRCEVDKE